MAAYQKIVETNGLPAVCGRVCPQESQCEKYCVRGKKGEPVGIGRLERFAADFAMSQGALGAKDAAPKKGKKVAVIGCPFSVTDTVQSSSQFHTLTSTSLALAPTALL